MDPDSLNETIETWFRDRHGVQIDFDVEDAVQKLERLGLTLRNAGTLEAISLDAARARIDTTWDGFFRFAAAPETP